MQGLRRQTGTCLPGRWPDPELLLRAAAELGSGTGAGVPRRPERPQLWRSVSIIGRRGGGWLVGASRRVPPWAGITAGHAMPRSPSDPLLLTPGPVSVSASTK